MYLFICVELLGSVVFCGPSASSKLQHGPLQTLCTHNFTDHPVVGFAFHHSPVQVVGKVHLLATRFLARVDTGAFAPAQCNSYHAFRCSFQSMDPFNCPTATQVSRILSGFYGVASANFSDRLWLHHTWSSSPSCQQTLTFANMKSAVWINPPLNMVHGYVL